MQQQRLALERPADLVEHDETFFEPTQVIVGFDPLQGRFEPRLAVLARLLGVQARLPRGDRSRCSGARGWCARERYHVFEATRAAAFPLHRRRLP
jgi:hypothetical protein